MNEFFTRPRMMRTARYAAYGLGAFVALVVAAALILPGLLDLPAVERELQAKLSQVAQGQVAWEKLSIRLLPSPRGTLSKVTAEIPGVASVHAEQLDAHLRLLPLLRGRAEIASLSLSRPAIQVQISPPRAAKEKSREEARSDPVESYRAVVTAIHGFAPETALDVDEGEVEVRVPEMPPIRMRKLELHGRSDSKGIALELTAASDAWSRLKVTASIDYGDVSGAAKAEIAGLKAQAWLDRLLAKSPVGIAIPEAGLRAEGRTDGKTRLECDFDLSAGPVEIVGAAERVQIPDVKIGGRFGANKEEIMLGLSGAQLGASRLAAGSLRYGLKSGALASLADFDLDMAQVMSATGRLVPEDTAKALARFAVSGRAQGQVKFDLQRSGWSTLVDIQKSDASVAMESLPGPVKLAGASVSVTRDAVKIDRAEVAMLDARAIASASISYGKDLRIEGAASEGNVGEAFLAWIWKTAGAPPDAVLKTPIRVTVGRASWGPKRPLDLAATASFDAGPTVAAELGWTPGALDIRRAVIKDARSDATLALRVKKKFLEGRFSGSLQSTSIGAMLKNAKVPLGGANGDLRFRVDLEHPEQFSVAGQLGGGSMDLSWLLERPVAIDRVDLQADGEKLRIREASVNWAGQHFTLRGELARAADGAPIVDAQLESPGVLVDALLARSGEQQAPVEQKTERPPDEALWTQWPLPVRGRIALRTDFIQYGKRKAAPVAAVLVLEEQRASLELQQVQLCGISLPLTVDATPAGLAINGRITAKKQELEQTARCLTEEGVLISGDFDLSADLRTKGRLRQLLPNLEGKVSADLRDGKVMKFALLGNILSFKGVSDLLKEGAPKADSAGFPYRSLSVTGRFAKGRFIIDESAFDSSALGLATTGWISLANYNSKLSVLVAPFARIDRLARKVPIIGYIAGGALTSIPVGVSGDIRNPLVVPLGPSAVTSELVGILERTLKLPEKLVPQGRDDPPGSSPAR